MSQAVTTKEEALSVNAGGVKQRQAKTATPVVAANQTTVSATLVDQGNITWANAQVTINFVPAPNIPGPYMWGGGPFSLRPQLTADSNGHFSIALPDNTTITPSGSTWQFVIAPAATMPAVIFNIMIAGSTMDISSIFTAQSYQVSLGVVQSLPLPRAYTDSDVATPPNFGQIYFNTESQTIRVWQADNSYVGAPPKWFGMQANAPIKLPDGTDLDNLYAAGVYTIDNFNLWNNASGQPILPYPAWMPYVFDPRGMLLITWGIAADTPGIQMCTFYNQSYNDPVVFMRTWSVNSAFQAVWWPWVAISGVAQVEVGTQQTDLNYLLATGTWASTSGFTANLPPNVTNSNGAVVEVFNTPGPIYYQRLVCPVDPAHYTSIYHRVYTGAWSAWYELLGTIS